MNLIRYQTPLATYRGLARSPWSGLESEIDRLFESAIGTGARSLSDRFPVDIFSDKENAYVRAELPGIAREDINVEVADGCLTITAVRRPVETPKNAGTETAEGETAANAGFSFSRSVSLPDDVEAGKVAAAYENGVLTVTLPKREESKPRRISVAIK